MTRTRIRCPQCRQPGTLVTTGSGTQHVEHTAHAKMDPTITAIIRVCTVERKGA